MALRHRRDTTKPTKADDIRALLEAGRFKEAVMMASKWQELGEQRGRILSAKEAYMRPDFQRSLGRDTDVLIRDGVEALRERYGTVVAPAGRKPPDPGQPV